MATMEWGLVDFEIHFVFCSICIRKYGKFTREILLVVLLWEKSNFILFSCCCCLWQCFIINFVTFQILIFVLLYLHWFFVSVSFLKIFTCHNTCHTFDECLSHIPFLSRQCPSEIR